MANDNHQTGTGSASTGSSRHPSPQPYPAPPVRSSTSGRVSNDDGKSSRDRESLSYVPQLELHRDVSNPFNHPLLPIEDERLASRRENDASRASSQDGAEVHRDLHGSASSERSESPSRVQRPDAGQMERKSSSSSATAVETDSRDQVEPEGESEGEDDELPPVIATDFCDSPAAVGEPEDIGGLRNGSDRLNSAEGGTSKHGSSSTTHSTPTPQSKRHRSPSQSSSRPRVMSGLAPSLRSSLPSLRRGAGSSRRDSLLPLPATTHRQPTTRGSQGGSASSHARRRDVHGDRGSGNSSSTSAVSTSRSQGTARRKVSNLSSQSSAPSARHPARHRAGNNAGDGSDSETEVERAQDEDTRHRQKNSEDEQSRPPGISGTDVAVGHAAASAARRLKGNSGDSRPRQNSRAGSSFKSFTSKLHMPRPGGGGSGNRGESFYAQQARMVREQSQTKGDNEMLRQQLAEDGLIMDDDGEVMNRDRGWSNPSSRGGSGNTDKEKGNGDGKEGATPRKQGSAHSGQGRGNGDNGNGEGGKGGDQGDGDDNDTPVPPMPRRTTLGTAASYTSTIVYTSVFADIKNDSIAMAGEFVGTILFLITSLGAAQAVASMHQEGDGPPDPQASTIENLIGTFYKAFATGTALYGTASIFYRFTGSIFNPSVSLALALTGVIRPVRFLLSTSQMLGGIVAAYILHGLIPGETDINLKLSARANIAQGLFIETFATTTLILTVLMLGVEKHLVTPHAPLGFGLTLSASMLFAMPYTGAGINVARAFGTALVQGFQPYHWIYWLGPTIGAFLASAFYIFLRYIQYWEVNPGQDSTQPLAGPPESGKQMRKKAGIKKRDALSPKQ